MAKKTRIEYAIEYISKRKKPSNYFDILDYVQSKLQLTDEEKQKIIAVLFLELSQEPTVIHIGNNMWNLSSRVNETIDIVEAFDSDSSSGDEDYDDDNDEELDYEDEDNSDSSSNEQSDAEEEEF